MASIKPIEGTSVHRIQSGQVIVDLCSAVKELVENSLDAGATSIDVRFRNHGLDAIEVQDNGSGIAKEDHESIALKHYTSKLKSYEDLETLDTFGFRGEALSSLCALSNVHVTTARENEAPKGTRLDFELSGKLKGTSVVAAQRGTTVFVETIFKNIPVRRQELGRNIKREYGKVLALLQAYACISTGVRFSVSNTMAKKKMNVFSTKGNKSTRENIANVYSAKALASLVPLDLEFEMHATSSLRGSENDHQVKIVGHVSRPVVGGGRPLPDRQMFFVNSRPCSLPQVSKVFNEVYKSYNLSQSPFVFANLLLDTHAYDVNVSPDKRTILLHDQGAVLEAIKVICCQNDAERAKVGQTNLGCLFEAQQQTVPQSERKDVKLPSYKPLTISRQPTRQDEQEAGSAADDGNVEEPKAQEGPRSSSAQLNLISRFAEQNTRNRLTETRLGQPALEKQKLVQEVRTGTDGEDEIGRDRGNDLVLPARGVPPSEGTELESGEIELPLVVHQASAKDIEPDAVSDKITKSDEQIPSVSTSPMKPKPGAVPNAFERMRPLRMPAQQATITIGNKIMTTTIGSEPSCPRRTSSRRKVKKGKLSQFASSLRSFAAPGTQRGRESSDGGGGGEEEEEEESMSEISDPVAVNQDTWKSEQEGEEGEEEGEEEEEEAEEEEKGEKVVTSDETEDEEDDDVLSGRRGKKQEHEVVDVESVGSDGEYLDEETKKKWEDARVARLIQEAEEKAARVSRSSVQRAQKLLKGAHKDSTTKLVQSTSTSISSISRQVQTLNAPTSSLNHLSTANYAGTGETTTSAEERLSLTVSKSDFGRMHIVGQFNFGFILAVRPYSINTSSSSTSNDPSAATEDDLFIIDQHASDEKFNFERLSSTTTLQNQRLVHPQTLNLTAIEEEIIADNQAALLANGFLVSIDPSHDTPVGRRCTLLSLPTSREATFDTRDLEELLALLSDTPPEAARDAGVQKQHNDRSAPVD
ncbi:MAG: hypothetical protein LQ340_004830 [Diploschistes diacapsis]|nr:MAG: hypothetical protein LQ340_004830 [Diploschistes diacapsis]